MKTLYRTFFAIVFMASLLLVALTSSALALEGIVLSQAETPTSEAPYPYPEASTPSPEPTATPTSTQTEIPTPTPTTEPASQNPLRPLIVVKSYSASVVDITPGKDFDLEIRLVNEGKEPAINIIIGFASGDFVPRTTGGVLVVNDIDSGNKKTITQPLTANHNLWGKTFSSLEVTVEYNDLKGAAYQETFTITFPIAWSKVIGVGATATPTPTITPTPNLRPQLVVTAYRTDLTPVQPGAQFTLELEVRNLGQANAKQVSMILGGGTSNTDPSDTKDSNPDRGGISGGSGDVSNFAPLGSSNVQSLGDLAVGASLTARQQLIVNVSTNPGAYPLKISFVYVDEKSTLYTDDQVITLLVYAPPLLELSFYRDPGPLFTNQPNALPLQVINLGRKSAILGNMKVSAEGADFTNNVIFIGPLEPGGFFTLDATAIPHKPGSLELIVEVNYTDDFNQPQAVIQTLTMEVMEAPTGGPEGFPGESPGPGGPGENGLIPHSPETFWQKILRFLRGLIGLDSGLTAPGGPGEMSPPEMEGLVPGEPPLNPY